VKARFASSAAPPSFPISPPISRWVYLTCCRSLTRPFQPEHEAAIAAAAKSGVGIVILGTVARGVPEDGHGSAGVWELWRKANMDELSRGMSATEFLLRFTITSPDIHTTIVGTLKASRLEGNVAAVLKGPLPPSLYQEAKQRLAAARSS